MLNTSVQHFFKYVERIFNSIFCSNPLAKVKGFLFYLLIANAKANGFSQILNIQFLISNGFWTYAQLSNTFSPIELVKYK